MNTQDFLSLQEAYMEVYNELDEGAAGDVAARAQKLANQRKGQTPERKATYQNLANKAAQRERGPHQRGDNRTGMTSSERERRRDAAAYHSGLYGETKNTYGKGGVTKNPRKLAQQKARGQHAEQYDIYDIILSHLLDEGYAETPEAAQVIMVNMSEEWRQDIMEGMTMKDFKANRQKNKRMAASADAKKRGHVGKEWYNSGRRYTPDEAKRSRANLDDAERSTRHRSAVEPDNESDDNFSADKTKNPKKLRKQRAMGEH